MYKLWKRVISLTLSLALLIPLAACGGGLSPDDATTYIQGILDENYKGIYDAGGKGECSFLQFQKYEPVSQSRKSIPCGVWTGGQAEIPWVIYISACGRKYLSGFPGRYGVF